MEDKTCIYTVPLDDGNEMDFIVKLERAPTEPHAPRLQSAGAKYKYVRGICFYICEIVSNL
jgi:hypothetical protein